MNGDIAMQNFNVEIYF